MAKKEEDGTKPLKERKRELFCKEFLKDLNAKQAAIRAGYSKNTATMQASRLLTFANVSKRIDFLNQKRLERIEIDSDWVLEEAKKMYLQTAREKEYTAAKDFLKLCGQHVKIKAFDKDTQLNVNLKIDSIDITYE